MDMSQIEDLVLAYRILAAHGVVDAYGHVSVRSERDPHRYLLARSMAPELVTADDILEFDLDSNVIHDPGAALYLERYIHGEIYKLRPEVQAVVHNHSPSVISFGVTNVPLRPIYHMSGFLAFGVSVFQGGSDTAHQMLIPFCCYSYSRNPAFRTTEYCDSRPSRKSLRT